MKKLFLILLLIPLFLTSAQVSVDYNFFDAGKGIYELLANISVPSNLIKYENMEGKLTGKLEINFIIKNLENNKTAKDVWNTSSYISKNEKINKKMSLIDNTSFFLAPGKYEMSTIIIDLFSNNKYLVIDTITLPAIDTLPHMSDIMLCMSVQRDTTNSRFTRNGFKLIPNPSGETTVLNPMIYIYSEYYNFPPDKDYTITLYVMQNQDTIQTINAKKGKTISEPFINIAGISTLGLKDGFYTLVCEIKYDSIVLKKEKPFSKSSEITYESVVKYNLSNKELQYLDKIEYIANSQELSKYQSLDEKGKYNFLLYFWESRDPDTTNNVLEALDDYIKKIEYVNKKFTSGGEEGYYSDRGKIYLKYGEPDEEFTTPSSTGYRAYESWIYYSNGGMQFVFSDIKGLGKYELIYSSEIEEEIPYNWETYIDPTIIKFKRD